MDELQEFSIIFLMIMQIVFLMFFMNNRTEEDDDEMNEGIMAYINARMHHDDPNRIKNYVRLTVMNNTEQQFQEHFRMSTTAFNWLLRELSPFLSSPRISGRQTQKKLDKLLAVLWLLATPDSYRSVGERFDMSKSELFDVFLKVIYGLNVMAAKIITWPDEARRRISEQRFVEKAGIPGVVGAIDGTYVRIKKPKENPEPYNNRKCFYSFTLQGICDHDYLFTDVFTGDPSSVSDIRIFRNSDIDPNFINNHADYFDEHQFILADKAYPLQKWCITPYIEHVRLTGRQKRFNSRHAKTRVVIENAWALLYGCYRRLRYLDMKRTDLIPATIVACCVLHNVCRRDPNDLAELYHAEGQQHLEQVRNNDNNVADNVVLEMMRQQGAERRDRIADALHE